MLLTCRLSGLKWIRRVASSEQMNLPSNQFNFLLWMTAGPEFTINGYAGVKIEIGWKQCRCCHYLKTLRATAVADVQKRCLFLFSSTSNPALDFTVTKTGLS